MGAYTLSQPYIVSGEWGGSANKDRFRLMRVLIDASAWDYRYDLVVVELRDPTQITPRYPKNANVKSIIHHEKYGLDGVVDGAEVEAFDRISRVVQAMNRMVLSFHAATPREVFSRLYQEELNDENPSDEVRA